MATHPSCGLYRTTRGLNDLPSGRLVYFHSHGEPGPGIYLPKSWVLNRVQWHAHGTPVPGPEWSSTMEPLLGEGLYRVRERFDCCEKHCHTFEAESLVQLGYDGEAHPILFTPEWSREGLSLPERGTGVENRRLALLSRLTVPEMRPHLAVASGLLH